MRYYVERREKFKPKLHMVLRKDEDEVDFAMMEIMAMPAKNFV